MTNVLAFSKPLQKKGKSVITMKSFDRNKVKVTITVIQYITVHIKIAGSDVPAILRLRSISVL